MIQSIVAAFWKGNEPSKYSLLSILFVKLKKTKKRFEANINNCQSQMVGEQVFLFLLVSVPFHLECNGHE